MRLALTTAAMLFLSTAAFADEAAAPAPAPVAAKKTPLRVVRVLEETHQALLFDKTKGTHVLVDLGKEIDGFKVDDIDEDTVTLTPIEGGAQVVLAAPDPSWRRHREGEAPGSMAKKPSAKPSAAIESAPMDPYAEEVRSAEAPDAIAAPIAAGEGGVRTAEAPGAAPAVRTAEAPGSAPTTVRTAEAPGSVSTTPVSTADTSSAVRTANTPGAPIVDTSSTAAWDSGPTATATTTPADKAKIDRELTDAKVPFAWESPEAPVVLAKADVSSALSNFASLGVRGSFTPNGARLDAIAPDSLLAKAGLKNGDVIQSINNQPLKSIDDAANLYARAGSMRAATVQIQRAGKPLSLRLTIQ